MKKVLFVRPSHDEVTAYIYHYSKELLNKADERGFKVINKEKANASRGIVTGIIEKQSPEFIMFNGHGNENIICGHQDEPIIETGSNHNILSNKMVYALACSCAFGLGKEVADDKTTFIGYSDVFSLGMDTNSQTTLQRDKRARLFMEPSNVLVKSLLKGNTAKQAVGKAKDLMKLNISKLRTDPFPDAKDYLPYLFNNYQVLELLGNEAAKL